MKQGVMKRYFTEWSFYKRAAKIAVPLALQQMLTSCLGIVDSLMVSWIGQVSAVGTAAQIETLGNTVAYGAIGGTGIFAAQFFGAKDEKNLKRTFGLSLILGLINGLIWFMIAWLFGKQVLGFYMKDSAVIEQGILYLSIAMFSYIPSSLSFCFSYIYRSIHKTYVPLIIGVIAMITNCIMNYVLIFGAFGFPEMGVQGAAMGTCIAQVLSLICHIVYAYKTKQPFIGSFNEMFHLDMKFVKPIMQRVAPLICNEFMFGFGSTLFVKAFGQLGTKSMDAYYVGSKISDVFFFVVMGISNATAAIVGSTLGEGNTDKAKEQGDYFVGMACVLAIFSTILIFVCAGPLVSLFQLQDPVVFASAKSIVQVFSIRVSLRLFIVIIFSTLRAGGDSRMLTLLDSGIMWMVGLPLAFISVNVFGLTNIALVFLIVQLEQVVRVLIGMKRYRSGIWAVNLTKLA